MDGPLPTTRVYADELDRPVILTSLSYKLLSSGPGTKGVHTVFYNIPVKIRLGKQRKKIDLKKKKKMSYHVSLTWIDSYCLESRI